jgi:SAM-dependent methyltransferase
MTVSKNVLAPTSDDRQIWDLWLSTFRLPAVSVADEVGTLAALTDRSLRTDELAQALRVDARALGIHLSLLAALGFVERRELRWRATALSRTWMHPDAKGYYGPLIGRYGRGMPMHAQMLATLKTGDRPTGHTSSAGEWERGAMPLEMAHMITAFMNAHSQAAALGLARQSLFGDVQALLDVGGGSGIFAIEVARAYPKLRATVMEIDTVCMAARPYIDASGVAARVDTRAVNMFKEPWPTGFDALFFSNIFHDWSDSTCTFLAKKAFEALPSGGRILLHEMLLDDDHCGPLPVAEFSMLMLLGTKGRQYSLPELRVFLEVAGFVDVDSQTTGGAYYSLVSARKP